MTTEITPTHSIIPKIAYGVVFLTVLGVGWMLFDQWQMRGEISAAQQENRQLSGQVETLEAEEVGDLYASQKILNLSIAQRIQWSKVAPKVLALENLTEDLNFSTVSIDPAGEVFVSGQAENLKTIAILIQRVRELSDFDGPFTPTIDGNAGNYGFQLQFAYPNIK